MKHLLLVFIWVLPLSLVGQESEGNLKFKGLKTQTGLSISTNLATIYLGEYSLGVEYYNSPKINYIASIGYAPNPRYGTLYSFDKLAPCDVGDGYFIRLGADYNLISRLNLLREHFGPFILYGGVRIVGNRVHEKVFDSFLDSTFEDDYSLNLGAAVTLGTYIHVKNRFSLKLGLQLGKDVLDNRNYSKYGYQPGMGIYWTNFRTQITGEFCMLIHRGNKMKKK